MKQINLKTRSIKWKIFFSLLSFIAIVILILWLFQVHFLENFYMHIKSKSVKATAQQINNVVYDADYKEKIDKITSVNEVCVVVYEGYNETPLFSSNEGSPRCRISGFSMQKNLADVRELQIQAEANGGTASKMLETTNVDEIDREPYTNPYIYHFYESPFLEGIITFELDNDRDISNRVVETMTYISVVMDAWGEMRTIVVNAQLTPVNSTIETIQAQFLIIAAILIVVASVLAIYLSKKIATPIIEINDSAKLLAEGKYDVTFHGKGYLEIQELNDTLNYAAAELSKVEKLRRELIANMSHDLRTPLTMIAGYGEIMRDIPGENTPENVQIIIDETKRLNDLVNDMLDLSKLQAGVQEISAEVFNFTREIEDILHRYDKLLSNDEIKIQFHFDQEVYVKADRIKIGQVIYNLINNAINYCGEDHLVIIDQIITGNSVKLCITDHGHGIAEEQLPYIWERYYKVDKTHVRSKVGSGLGLSIVRAVLELHKAEYGVESKIDQGTKFWFMLPMEKETS